MTATLNSKAHALVRTLIVVLFATLFASAYAQSTQFERELAFIIARDTNGTIVSCPADYAFTDLASCFTLPGSLDLATSYLELAVLKYGGDTQWGSPWYADGAARARYIQVEDRPAVVFFVTQDYRASNYEYSSVVWVIEAERTQP